MRPGRQLFPATPVRCRVVTAQRTPLTESCGDWRRSRPPARRPLRDVEALRPTLERGGDTVVVLVTDGAPNCNFDAVCDADECTLNIERATLGTRACTPNFNCCDAELGPDLGGYCVDSGATEAAIAALYEAGIPTYVIGMPGAEPYAALLERLARAGGTAREDGAGYYAVSHTSELREALYAIGTGVAIRCSIELAEPPLDRELVNVYFDGELLPADEADGWSWDDDGHIVVNGEACERLSSGAVLDARAVFGCETVVR